MDDGDIAKNVKLLRVWIDRGIVGRFKERCYRNNRSMTEVLIEFMNLYCK